MIPIDTHLTSLLAFLKVGCIWLVYSIIYICHILIQTHLIHFKYFMSNYFITKYIASYDLYRIPDFYLGEL